MKNSFWMYKKTMSEDLITHILTKKCTEIPDDDTEKLSDPFATCLQAPVTDLHSSVLPPAVLQDIDLHLECDEDGMMSVPGEISSLSHSVVGQNVSLRITFPLQKQNIERKKVIWQCTLCKEKFQKQSMLAVHLQEIHKLEKGFQCSLCSFATTEKRLLRRHCGRKHSGKESSDLTNTVTSPLSLKIEELEKGSIKSDLCTDKSKDRTEANPISLDTGLSVFQLKTDSNEYSGSDIQFTRLKSKDPFCYVCSQCPYKTSFKHHLAQHFTDLHDVNWETFKCKLCGYTCKKKDTFHIHEKKHTGLKSCDICTTCGKDFVSSTALKRHMRCHNDDTKAVCKIGTCGKEFKNIDSLNSHMYKIHNQCKDTVKSKSFLCSWSGCGKSFRDNYNLKAHLCLHTGETPIKCPHCAFRCVQKTSLSCHMKKMH